MSVIITESEANVTLLLEDCLFEDNYAQSAGGALYLSIDGDGTHHSINISRCQFNNNQSPRGAGGASAVAFLSGDQVSVVNFVECSFHRNFAQFGGGIIMPNFGTRNFMNLIESNFTDNSVANEGSAVVFGSLRSLRTEREVSFYGVYDW